MCWQARLFNDIGLFFWDLHHVMHDLGGYFRYDTPFTFMAAPCYDMADFFGDITFWFGDVALEIDSWWDEISGLASDLNSLYNYAHDYLWDLANAAYGYASTAYAWARAALDAAQSALQEIPAWILEKLTLAYNLASTALQEIPAWITVQFSELQGGLDSIWDYARTTVWNKAVDAWNYAANAWNHAEELLSGVWADVVAWVNGIPAAIENFVNDRIEAIGAVTTEWVNNLLASFASSIAAPFNLVTLWFDSIQSFFTDPLEWLWAKFTDWFIGPE